MSTTAITKTTSAAPAKPGVLNALAAKLECDPAKLLPMLKKTAFAACKTDEEFMAMCVVANTYDLNPILKEIYAFPGKSGGVIPIVGVDGWNNLCNRQPNYDGVEFIETDESCTAIIYRKDRSHPTKITEYLSECVGNTSTWRQWPRRMLRHKAFIQAARMAFGFAGIYDEDEARRIVEVQTIEAETAEPPKTAKKGLRSALGIAAEETPAPDPKNAPEAAPDAPEVIAEEMFSDDLPL